MANTLERDETRAKCSPFDGGNMGHNPLDEQSGRGFEQYSNTFGKFLSDKDERKKFSDEDRLKRERAKKANRIYKKVCEDLQLNACFFSNFGDWSQYVDGKMSDAEFHNHAITRAQQMAADQN